MPNLPIITFNKGKLTPLIDARSDVEAYAGGCRIDNNMIPLIYGPATRRPGTKYIADAENHTVKSKMFNFVFSATIAYKLEFSDLKINVYFGDDLVDSVTSPYLEADLFQLQTKQIADVMWITHPSYAPRKFSRVSVTEFTLATITFSKGPFIERNDIANDDDVTITVTGTTIATATAGAAGAGTFTTTNTTDTSSLFPVNQRFFVTGSTGNDGAYTVASVSFSTPTLTITATEAVADGTDDGEIMVTGGEVTLTASSATFVTGTSGHAGALFKLKHKRLQSAVSGKKTGTSTGIIGQSISIKGNFTFTTGGHHDSTVELQRLADGTNWETFRSYISTLTSGVGSNNAQKSHVEESDNVQYRINVVTHDVSSTVNANITVDDSTQDSIFRITATASTTSATATAVIAAPDNVAAKRWSEGSWSAVRGYPAAITFFEERAVYGFTVDDGRTVWLSETGKFEDFEAGIKDADSFAITLPTTNRGRWLASLETLAAGTSGGEWRIKSPLDQKLTPTNWDFKNQTKRGSADIQAIEVNEAILFVDFVAGKVREFTFSDPRQKYVSPDLTSLAEDITSGGITSLAIQRNPDVIIWFTITNSPYLVSMTYEREQNVVAWANHPLGGNGIAESVIVTPSSSENIITLTVRRIIDGSTVRFIEELHPKDWGSTTSAANSFFVDAGIVDTGGTTTITGLGHLEGEEVIVLVDGAVQKSKTVSSGQITIDTAGSRAVVGLSYQYQLSPMRPDVVTGAGTTRGSIMVTPEIVVSLFASGGVEYGDGTNQRPIDFRTTEPLGSPPALFTGEKDKLAFDGGFNTDMDIVISGSGPLPCTVRAIILKTEKTGR